MSTFRIVQHAKIFTSDFHDAIYGSAQLYILMRSILAQANLYSFEESMRINRLVEAVEKDYVVSFTRGVLRKT